jgi:23S rRNA (adenine2503-C2)-methyltransferase
MSVQAQELAQVLKQHRMATHVNLIPWNPVDESDFERPSGNSVSRFRRTLEAAGIDATVRTSRGLDAAAACGQLRNMYQKQTLPDYSKLE